MRWALAVLALGLLLGSAAGAQPAPGARAASLTLRDAQEVVDAAGLGRVWIDTDGDATERMMEAPELADALSDVLRSMSPRTRRPIRFIQPEDTHPAGLQDSSLLLEEAVQPKPEEKKKLTVA